MKQLKYIGMLLLSVATLGMTLYVLLSAEPVDPVTNIQEMAPEADSLKSAWIMMRDSLSQSR